MPALESHWYRRSWLSLLLLPLSAVFYALSALRRLAYRAGLLRAERLPVPVIVVGNITVGGTGKTPLVLWLCDLLQQNGYRPGIVSRGYGGRGATHAVNADTDPALVGDEPVLLAQRSRCPVWVGRDRAWAARALLAAHPGCNVILSDDGLQHLRLQADLRIAVVDGRRGFGNGYLLPAGPLREGTGRLSEVDAVVVNGEPGPDLAAMRLHRMTLEGEEFRNLLDPGFCREAAGFHGRQVHAIAGIGNPLRFFEHLQRLGLQFTAHPFPDHHDYAPADVEFPGADIVVMTEKDAIKCRRFARECHWYLPVDARIDPALGPIILDKLKARHGS